MEIREIKKTASEGFYILIITAVISLTVNLFHPRGYVLISNEELKNRNIVAISVEEARIKYDNNALFIDSRSPQEHAAEHIPGSINIPASPESLTLKKIQEYFSLLKKPREIVIYCMGASCGSSEMVAKSLIEMNYDRHIYFIEKGLPEWKKSGHPVQGEE